MHRFFVSPDTLCGERFTLTGPLAQQLGRVLRLHRGEHIALLDDSGWAYEVELESVSPVQVITHLVGRSQPPSEPQVRLVLYQALVREQRYDWVLQKGTELGVSVFVPLITERSIVSVRQGSGESKLPRWQRIITEAAEQSGRARLPRIVPARPFAQACEPAPPGVLAFIAWVSADALPLGQALRTVGAQPAVPLQEIRLFVGPEGDFSPAEIALARQADIVPVSLGPRILRTETAALVAFSAILYALGEFG